MKLHLEIELTASEVLKASQKLLMLAASLESPVTPPDEIGIDNEPETAVTPTPLKKKGGRPRKVEKDVDPSHSEPVKNGGVQSIELPSVPATPKVEAPKPVEAVQEKAVSHSITLENVITMFKLLSYVESREKAFDVLKSFGVNSVHMLPESSYPAVKAKIDSLLPKE